MTQVLGVGDFLAWQGGCLVIGHAYRATGLHVHYAMQLSFGVTDGIAFRARESEPWGAHGAAVIASRQPHMMDGSVVGTSATMLLELETPVGRKLQEIFARDGITSIEYARIEHVAKVLFATWEAHRDGEATAAAARAAIRALTGDTQPQLLSDERVIKAVAYINAKLSSPLSLRDIAGHAFLSPPRFRHVFVEQTGSTLRPYVLWRRFLRAWEVIRQGDAISTAAHEAGFADAAHRTRTSRRMFGFAPSALLVGRQGWGAVTT